MKATELKPKGKRCGSLSIDAVQGFRDACKKKRDERVKVGTKIRERERIKVGTKTNDSNIQARARTLYVFAAERMSFLQ